MKFEIQKQFEIQMPCISKNEFPAETDDCQLRFPGRKYVGKLRNTTHHIWVDPIKTLPLPHPQTSAKQKQARKNLKTFYILFTV